ncbi:MAG TPA: DM13 domain-containing protein [Dehalococcoidia bacterium]|nr:DM13 domain-containing protein [Dehalococcoidia bacterium]
MLSTFGDIERVMADLYDYRYPITALLAVVTAAGIFAAYRAGLHRLVWRHRLLAAATGAPMLVAALIAGDYLLSPLWERSFLEEASPVAAAAIDSPGGSAAPVAPAGAFAPRTTHRGEFVGADSFHFGRGKAFLIETEPGRYVLRFEDFSVRNGPDLYVYLSPDPDGYDSMAVNLGRLKATDGSFNYDVPPGVDISQVRSAIIWCRQFAVLFAAATFR